MIGIYNEKGLIIGKVGIDRVFKGVIKGESL
jgi:hypothetical protein